MPRDLAPPYRERLRAFPAAADVDWSEPVLSRALAHRGAVAGLVGAGMFVAAIETALPLIVGRIVEAYEGPDSAPR